MYAIHVQCNEYRNIFLSTQHINRPHTDFSAISHFHVKIENLLNM